MNIKGIFGNILPTSPIRPAGKTEKAIKSDATADRDANGQQAGGGEEQQHDPMTDEQLEKTLEQLRNLSGVKEHHWIVELLVIETKRFAVVKDLQGTVIRRIPEQDLWSLSESQETGKGQLFKKSA
jgi:hypothetical protein